jgi:hypothetical protein
MAAASIAVLRNLREQGLLCATHTLRQEGREIVALPQSEIAQLQNAGISVEVLDSVELDLSHGAPLADIASSFVIWRTEAASKDPEGTLEGVFCRLLCRTHPARHREKSRPKNCYKLTGRPRRMTAVHFAWKLVKNLL